MSGLVLPRIKVCGLTLPAEAARAAAAGVDAIGVVGHPGSPRALAAAAAAAVVAALPPRVVAIAVLVDAAPAAAAAWCAATGVAALQLCGRERPADFAGFPWPLLRRLAVADGAEEELEAWRGLAAGFVLDHPAAPGGSGRHVDAERAASLAARAPCLLAGGLGPDDVAAAIAAVRPHGVDASSRLERAPGRKDADLVRRFVAAALAAFDLEGR